ncbi:uncharacterized protein LOC104898974 [Beta vulgaris subsp. vulgaris]|uniref:uncharacterized protein LOC104898974 n=1 Tax=Beta vulgaris subsp. vulgaris TaxID=3555 RepID=UPI00053FDFAB|nr:uncharacterized protein LOC104898974 [Beta vulgaris subsp. vulgaris]
MRVVARVSILSVVVALRVLLVLSVCCWWLLVVLLPPYSSCYYSSSSILIVSLISEYFRISFTLKIDHNMGDQAMYSLMIEPVPSNYNLDEQISFAFGFRIRENVVVIYVGIKHCSKLAALLLCICRTCFVIQTEKW